ncbi:hypothetical protein O1D97_01970 [Marinomonas sp. 15G1-11]|uniref:HEPN domain-containing protein n=1 Tax=Marinomonas phaeophyticola TaxID=3004091 RepID=A0ABT4JPY9_9GAMM|nr:DUF6586 family protein [Marinomonas sp. 15G1-11]MCZ2720443.1 hypothetical protein [Marinomonas sp. 15G1-11]
MSNPSEASVTNQRLDVARRFLIMTNGVEESWMEKAYENAALFHLKSAINGLLQEVCSNYSLKRDMNISALLGHAQEKGTSIPVLQELNALSFDPASWFSQLEKDYTVAIECYSRSPVVVSTNVIASSQSLESSIAFYLKSITELVLRYREESSEY